MPRVLRPAEHYWTNVTQQYVNILLYESKHILCAYTNFKLQILIFYNINTSIYMC